MAPNDTDETIGRSLSAESSWKMADSNLWVDSKTAKVRPHEPPETYPATRNPLFHVFKENFASDYPVPVTPFGTPVDHAKPAKTWFPSELDPDVEPGDRVYRLGAYFTWTKYHWKGRSLDALRQIGDDLADDVLNETDIKPMEDTLETILRLGSGQSPPESVVRLLRQLNSIPEWLEEDRIRRGQQFFMKRSGACLTSLLYYSLIGGFAAPKINKVLNSTGYLSKNKDATFTRLLETLQMIVDCMEEGALVPGGSGWKSVIRVRFLHAKVRRRLLRMPQWDVEQWGIPINQEDMAVTQMAFTVIMMGGVSAMGIPISRQDAEDYCHLWRYIGYLIGVKEEYNPSVSLEVATAWSESSVMHLVEPDASGTLLAINNLEAVAHKPPHYLSPEFHSAMARWFCNPSLSHGLGFPQCSKSKAMGAKLYLFLIALGDRVLGDFPVLGPILCSSRLRRIRRGIEVLLGGKATKFQMKHSPGTEGSEAIEEDGVLTLQRLRELQRSPTLRLLSILLFIVMLHNLRKRRFRSYVRSWLLTVTGRV